MTQSVYNQGARTFIAGEKLEPYRRVKLKTGTTTIPPEIVYADAGESCIGITQTKADIEESIAINLLSKQGTFLIEAADSFSIGADLYGAADGKFSDTESGAAQFIAIEEALADGDIIEALVKF